MPGRSRAIVNLPIYPVDIDLCLIEPADGCYTGQGGAKLLEQRRFRCTFQPLYRSSCVQIIHGVVDAYEQEESGESKHIVRDQQTSNNDVEQTKEAVCAKAERIR